MLALGEGGEAFLLGVDLGGSLLGQGRKRLPLFEHCIEVAAQLGREVEGRLFLVLQIFLVFLAVGRRDLLVVAGQGLEGLRRHALAEFLATCEADNGVAALDVVVQEVERLCRGCAPRATAPPCTVPPPAGSGRRRRCSGGWHRAERHGRPAARAALRRCAPPPALWRCGGRQRAGCGQNRRRCRRPADRAGRPRGRRSRDARRSGDRASGGSAAVRGRRVCSGSR